MIERDTLIGREAKVKKRGGKGRLRMDIRFKKMSKFNISVRNYLRNIAEEIKDNLLSNSGR